jgi:hypothetical protein
MRKKLANPVAKRHAAKPAPRRAAARNCGLFKAGDKRINRLGRPRGSKVAAKDSHPGYLAPRTDRLMLLAIPGKGLLAHLGDRNTLPIVNLPNDVEVIASRSDPGQGVVLLTLRSQTFERVAKGTPMPEFAAVKRGQENAQVFIPRRFANKFLRSMYARVPDDAAIVGCRWDDARGGAVFSVVTPMYGPAAAGKPLPEFRPN